MRHPIEYVHTSETIEGANLVNTVALNMKKTILEILLVITKELMIG